MESASHGEHILIVEDEARLARSVAARLQAEGYRVTVAETGEDAFFLVHTLCPNLMVLDLNLPRRGGLEVLRQLRQEKSSLPVLILTSQASLEDRIRGLDAGADDYLGKPFAFAELHARIRSLLRRSQGQISPVPAHVPLQLADLAIDLETRTVTRSSMKLDLTTREFDLLVYLMEHRNRTVSRDMLARDVWHETARFTPINNVIDVQITRLRRKLDDPFQVKLLHTVRGVGFILRETAP